MSTPSITTNVIDIKSTCVIINEWRNRNATAFVTVSAEGPLGCKSWEAKSQGPSAGGVNKPDQARKNVFKAITGKYRVASSRDELQEIAEGAVAAVEQEAHTRGSEEGEA